MRLFEYQGKDLFRKYGIPVPESVVVRTGAELDPALQKVGLPAVVKAQVLAGGRGKAGGVAVVKTRDEARKAASRIWQLRIGGETPSALLLEKAAPLREEMYLSITLDRGTRSFVVIAARVGGVDVESMQGKIIEPVPVDGLKEWAAKSVGFRMNLWGQDEARFVRILTDLERLCRELECELAEINPLAITG
ncbi:MAG: ATP-grasp domain-containing protein, partial [Nitrososphaerales archaeon]